MNRTTVQHPAFAEKLARATLAAIRQAQDDPSWIGEAHFTTRSGRVDLYYCPIERYAAVLYTPASSAPGTGAQDITALISAHCPLASAPSMALAQVAGGTAPAPPLAAPAPSRN